MGFGKFCFLHYISQHSFNFYASHELESEKKDILKIKSFKVEVFRTIKMLKVN